MNSNQSHIPCLDISQEKTSSSNDISKQIHNVFNSLSSTEQNNFIILVTKDQYNLISTSIPTLTSSAMYVVSSIIPPSKQNDLTYRGRPVFLGLEDIYKCPECFKRNSHIIMLCKKHYKTILALDKLRK